MDKKLFEKCRTLIGNGWIKESLQILTENLPNLKTNLILLSSRLSKNENENNWGTITTSEYNAESTKISKSLLCFIQAEEKNCDTETNKKPKELETKIFKFEQIQTGNELLKLMKGSNAQSIDNVEIKSQNDVDSISDLTSFLEDYFELLGVTTLQHRELLEFEISINQKLNNLQNQGYYLFAKQRTLSMNGLKFNSLHLFINNVENPDIFEDEQTKVKFMLIEIIGPTRLTF